MNARILRQAAAGIAALGLLAPATILTAAELPSGQLPTAVPSAAMISDVALGAKGTLRGQVVDAAGGAMAGVRITVHQQENLVAETTSSPTGKFELAGLPGGIFQITTDHSEGSFRLWAPETAPPGARPSLLVVDDQATVRGQSALGRLLSRPLAIVGIVATAVAVPVIIHQIQIDRKPGS